MTRHGRGHGWRVTAGERSTSCATPGQRLAREAADAAEVRAYQTDPDVVALRVERVRVQVDRMCWAGIVGGLCFTMTNVQHFAAGGAAAWSLPWLAAWLLDPTVSVVLLAILRAEQVTARYQIRCGPWVRRARWFTLASTYLMNVWASFVAGSVSAIVLHSVPPLLVFTAAEAVTDLRDKLTDAVNAAYRHAHHAGGPVNTTAADGHGAGQQSAGVRGGARKLFADYLADARAAWTPAVTVSPAWVRQVTGCSRGLSSRLARALAAEVAGHDGGRS